MLQPVSVATKSLADYASIVGRPLIDEIRELADGLKGKRVLHLSATAFGGGVAEILNTLVPLMRDVGLECEWHVIYGRGGVLQHHEADAQRPAGQPAGSRRGAVARSGSATTRSTPRSCPRAGMCASSTTLSRPRSLRWWATRLATGYGAATLIYRVRIKTRWRGSPPYLAPYQAAVFHMQEYVPSGVDGRAHIIPPAIDPLAPKNMAFSPEDAVYICEQFGIDVDRPLLCQVSRFDPWKDPLGVIDAYRIVKQEIGDVQLALVGSMATDDPEGWDYFNATVAHADGDPDIHILNNLNNVGAIEVNAFQSYSDVVIQKSTREGFGLTVTEAIWKAKPFIGGAVGGIPLQVTDGESGFLVSTVEDCAERAIEVLRDPGLGKQLGRAGKESVRQRFLMPRLLRDWLRVFEQLQA